MLLVSQEFCFFVQPSPFKFFLHPHIVYVCSVSVSFVCLYFYMCVCVFPLSPFHSDLDCPVVWGSSGLLLFSCSLRYLFHCLAPSAFKLSPLCFHFIVLDPKLGDCRFETNTQAYIFFYTPIHTSAHSLMCTHLCFLEIT